MMSTLLTLAAFRASAPGPTLMIPWQTPEGMGPLPAEPPIGGPFWTVVVPAVLLIGSFVATYLLYQRFAREGD